MRRRPTLTAACERVSADMPPTPSRHATIAREQQNGRCPAKEKGDITPLLSVGASLQCGAFLHYRINTSKQVGGASQSLPIGWGVAVLRRGNPFYLPIRDPNWGRLGKGTWSIDVWVTRLLNEDVKRSVLSYLT